jgi:hypothetical protein
VADPDITAEQVAELIASTVYVPGAVIMPKLIADPVPITGVPTIDAPKNN